MLIGGAITWFGQGKFRRRLRERTRDAYRWHSEAHHAQARDEGDRFADRGLPAPSGAGKA